MKKMLFSAIAMVAFTVSANAANEVVESVETITSKTPCANDYSTHVAILKYLGFGDDQAKSIALDMFFDCLSKTHGQLPNTMQPTK